MSTPRSRLEIDENHPAASAVLRADELYRQRDVPGCDAACVQAVTLARNDPRLRADLATHHVAWLVELRDLPTARARCEAYLDTDGAATGHVPLRILRVEILAATGHSPAAAREATAIRYDVLARGGSLTVEEEARLCRVQGVAEGEWGHHARADALLDRAGERFEKLGDTAAVEHIKREKAQLGVMAGDQDAVRTVADAGHRETVADEFVFGVALKRLCRYEEALQVMVGCALRADLAPAMRWSVLREVALLLRAVGQDETVDGLTPLLTETAALAADRPGAQAELARLLAPGAPTSGTFMERVQYARHLLGADKLGPAERIVTEVRDRAATGLELAMWHLAAGELEFKLHRRDDAIAHLKLSYAQAQRNGLIEVQVQALRLLGHASFGPAPDSGRQARECWDEARRLEEGILARQVSDEVRRRMSLTIADTFDEWIDAAVEAGAHFPRGHTTAAVVTAMEAARGASILPEILPDEASGVRDLPRPGDHGGAWDWVGAFAGELPRSQVAWLMHAAPGHVHHAVIGRGFLFHVTVPCHRGQLQRAVDAFAGCCSNEGILERSLEDDEFGKRLARIAALVGVDQVIERLPTDLRRIAVVAGDMLSDVPFGAMTVDGVPLGVRYALSDLPCLSALAPLRLRARRTRGSRRLLVSPRPEGTSLLVRTRRREERVDEHTPPDALRAALERSRRHLMILDRHATPDALRGVLQQRRHRLVRIYSHGKHDNTDSGRSKLQLAPEGDRGAVRADDLQRMDLRGCGTLVLGACETGMARRIGRDERTGFVRAAFVAGAASAIAARWVAPADVAAELLDRFEAYARHLPRDIALQRAQRDLYVGAPGTLTELAPARRHPANWAGWTLYGDSGFQTRAGPVLRNLRTFVTRRRYARQRWRRAAAGLPVLRRS